MALDASSRATKEHPPQSSCRAIRLVEVMQSAFPLSVLSAPRGMPSGRDFLSWETIVKSNKPGNHSWIGEEQVWSVSGSALAPAGTQDQAFSRDGLSSPAASR